MQLRRLRPDGVIIAAIASGLLLALAYPRPSLSAVAWFALVPLLLKMQHRPFQSGFIAGIAFFAPVLYWLNIVMTTYGGLNLFFSVVAYFLLVAYLALFFGAATWASCRLQSRLALPLVATFPVLWVALELVRNYLFTGFPWALVGYSQGGFLTVIQSADLFGVYGISFLVVLVNAAIAATVRALTDKPPRALPMKSIAIAAVFFFANLGYGHVRLAGDLESRQETIRTTLVQGNIDQSIKWDPAFQQATIERYRDLSLQAADGAELIIWPESATPFYFQDPGPLSREVREVSRSTGAFLLLGSPAYEIVDHSPRYLNSAFLLGTGGEILGRSDKIHLVPFGEYVPFGRFFPFVDKLVVGVGDFSPGVINPLPMNGAMAGVLVCFEGIFPELGRKYVREGSDLLVNITNDAWFGRSSAPYQHLGMTRFRAIENRIWVARAANTGITAFISPSGRITSETRLFETAVLEEEIGLGAHASFYTRTGDVFPMIFVGISLFWLLRSRYPATAKVAVSRPV